MFSGPPAKPMFCLSIHLQAGPSCEAVESCLSHADRWQLDHVNSLLTRLTGLAYHSPIWPALSTNENWASPVFTSEALLSLCRAGFVYRLPRPATVLEATRFFRSFW